MRMIRRTDRQSEQASFPSSRRTWLWGSLPRAVLVNGGTGVAWDAAACQLLSRSLPCTTTPRGPRSKRRLRTEKRKGYPADRKGFDSIFKKKFNFTSLAIYVLNNYVVFLKLKSVKL